MGSVIKHWRILEQDISLNCPSHHVPYIEQAVERLKACIENQKNQGDGDVHRLILAGLQLAHQLVLSEQKNQDFHEGYSIWSSHMKQRIKHLLEKKD